ncbi:enoyl-CoA hydratase/isomerase family protein [Pseudomonas sp. H9]|uniref:enoyl-CoA hydratase/isomerase family protein n=1 Tax=Pseudomonas sp. H9 TaxID=483968 RepID=UPI001C49B619|nr:enoyl-CoA hydratase-related protein [Pseudomonas sp. H9]
MSQSPLVIERQSAVLRLRFNRPEVLNALDVQLAQCLREVFREIAVDPDVRVVVLSGSGRAFMAGGDLNALRADPVGAATRLIEPMHEAIRLISELPQPVIASVQGVAAGAGLSLLLAADLVVAAEEARFNFAYTDIGTCCDGGASWSLPRAVGLRQALSIALLGEGFSAAEALQMGMLTRVVPQAALDEAVSDMARRLASREPHALAHLKRLMRGASQHSLAEQLEAEHAAFVDCARRPEFVAAIDGFYARRSARVQGVAK